MKTQPNSLRPCSAKTDAHWEDLCGFVTNQVKQRGRGPRETWEELHQIFKSKVV